MLHLAAGLPSSIAGLDLIPDLLSRGCQINKRNSENRTALFFAHNTSMACYLISKGALGCVVDCTGGTVLHYITNNLTKDKHHIINALLNQTSVNIDGLFNVDVADLYFHFSFTGCYLISHIT